MAWSTRFLPGYAPDGGPILSILAKKTFSFRPGEAAMEDHGASNEWMEIDQFWGTNNPATEATKLESELVAWKPCTDVVVIGDACSPTGKRARFFDAGIKIGKFQKSVRVFGNRKIQLKTFGFAFTEPEVFERMPLHYGLAYGGRHMRTAKGDELSYPRNPVGRGFVVQPTPEELLTLQLPNLENPARILTPDSLVLKSYEKWVEAPEPWALGFTSRNFHPRLSLAGLPPSMATEAEITRLQTVNDSGGDQVSAPTPVLNPEFHCGASKGLVLPHLKGDESVVLEYMDPEFPLFEFQLPGAIPTARIDVGMGWEWMDMVLHSVVIFKGTNQVEMIWRGSCRYDGPESMKDWEMFAMSVEE
ncbi:MAG: DUF2169 domain-containing protein [Fibrobacteria bacterium]|nr:DUF2169 domain-containing protein [Fibrobacteria bacterium]